MMQTQRTCWAGGPLLLNPEKRGNDAPPTPPGAPIGRSIPAHATLAGHPLYKVLRVLVARRWQGPTRHEICTGLVAPKPRTGGSQCYGRTSSGRTAPAAPVVHGEAAGRRDHAMEHRTAALRATPMPTDCSADMHARETIRAQGCRAAARFNKITQSSETGVHTEGARVL